MSKKVFLTHAQIEGLAIRASVWVNAIASRGVIHRVYGVPRGGIPAAMAIGQQMKIVLVDNPDDADVIVDDIVDSGATRDKFAVSHPNKPFIALIDKTWPENKDMGWVVFPWEGNTAESSFEDNVTRLLQFVGEDPKRGGLQETPHRVAKAWQFWCSGYGKDPKDILKVFEDGGEKHNQMIVVKDLPFYTHCEHHLAPFFGTATIGYIPNGKIVGLSKLPRLLDVFARRLQVQERLTDQVADALFDNLSPLGVGVAIKARHMCMESRGICQQGHHTMTTALRGVVLSQSDARAEFLRLV